MGCHAFLQGIFPTQRLDLSLSCLIYWQVGSLPLLPPGKSNLVIPKLRWESLEDESSLIWEDQVREMVCVSLGVTGYNSNTHAQKCHSPRQSHLLPGGAPLPNRDGYWWPDLPGVINSCPGCGCRWHSLHPDQRVLPASPAASCLHCGGHRQLALQLHRRPPLPIHSGEMDTGALGHERPSK